MSTIYTEYLASLPTDGSRPDEELAEQVLAQMRKDLRRQLRKRGLWDLPPSLLGTLGSSWDEDTLEDLVHDGYLHVFGERLKNLRRQLKVRDNVDGLVVLNLQHFLTELQRKADPIGYRVYELLSSAVGKAVEAGDVHVLGGDDRVRNDTVFGFSPRMAPERVTTDLDVYVSAWNDDLLPDLITARGRAVTKVVECLKDHVLGLKDEGVEAFHFRDVVQPLKWDVRRRWAAVWDQDAGEVGAEVGEAGTGEMVRVVQPDAYDDGRSLEWLLECVPNSIDQRKDDRKKDREGLSRLWEYFRGFSSGSDPSEGGSKLPSFSTLGKLLGIYRERVPVLLGILRGIVEACREREGRPAKDEPTEARQAQPALRKNETPHSENDTERRATP